MPTWGSLGMEAEFDTTALGCVASVRSGFAFKSRDWRNSGVPVVKIANVKNGRLEMNGCSFVSQNVADSAGEFALRAGDVVMAMTGYIGDVALVRAHDVPAVLNQRVGLFTIRDGNRLDQDFLFYLLRAPSVRNEIESLGYGSAQPNVSPKLIHGVEIPLPTVPEQRAIAHILGTLDDKIELNRRMSKTLESMARALFKSWFVDFDPVRAKLEGRWKRGESLPGLPASTYDLFPERLVPSELGDIPEGWQAGNLGDVAEHRRRSIRVEQIEPGTPYIALSHMPKQSIALPDWDTGGEIQSNKFEFKRGEILFGKLRPYFHKVGVAPVNGVCSTDIVVVAPKSEAWFGPVLEHMSSSRFVEYTSAGSTGTKMPRTSWPEMARYELALPEESVAKSFTELVHPAIERIVESVYECRALAAIRDTLLPKLISGELRVKDAERIVGGQS